MKNIHCIMPKVTYPRPCPTCGKEFSVKRTFNNHKQHCGIRYQCPLCPMSFSRNDHRHRHVRQQHSKTPDRFPCTICEKVFTSKQRLKQHTEAIHSEEKPYFQCWYCDARYAWKSGRQNHMRQVHGRVCREQNVNLQLHLQRLSEENEFQGEWQLAKARPVLPGEPRVCPCGETTMSSCFFPENKINGNRTFTGSKYAANIDPEAEMVIYYFKEILEHEVEGIYKGEDNQGLKRFEFKPYAAIIRGLPTMRHLNPPVAKNCEGQWEVVIKHTKPTMLAVGQTYVLLLKMTIKHGQLTFVAL